MADPLATLDDLNLLYTVTAGGENQATGLLAKASQLLRAKAPHTDARITAGTLDPDVVATVVAGIVARFLNNPKGAAAKSITTGPYSESITFASRASLASAVDTTGQLRVTKDDLDQLKPYAPASRIGSIRLRPSLAPRYGLQGDRIVEDGLLDYPDDGLPEQIGPEPLFPPVETPEGHQ